MPFRPYLLAILLPLTFLAASGALAQQAAPADRCTGTACDLYYGGSAPDSAQPPAGSQTGPTPLTVPGTGFIKRLFGGGDTQAQPGASGTTSAPARPLVGVGGGGIAAMARGEKAERCTGTLCDFFYGGPPPPPPPEQPAAGVQPQATADAAPEPSADETQSPRALDVPERKEPQVCAPMPGDPWKCYR
jgi:hypothetical protein